ncbi:MAG: protein-L-isoaspartate O-methyltransferase [Alphaproteobacteria bacterium]|jgi:protein-L-isoaspartate(D-aspartate) O-methyltransferase|nr:protein-L-isoaspartate O-methyltransferase [Alphaproteobacteria bacterium]MBU2041021.1 protein-L-isoaspartate O-methyltransferase [Alphaproteobacteria bacterium]MBU2127094.1 protein-L-isoaspartate O-methyltransferase [Alphaproteobacteria bacterium]MBU2207800.1 protein-L-isoaspartate O-methyltransferase [Alphaproteobacteria bacterium]MBU2289576.1 protein-L-isoaspartate O-methyltransferase [Alphaproteobacteria bacterium]
MDFAAARKVMVDSQVRVNDVTDRALQAALLAVPRERFLPEDRAWSAYAEIEPEIAGGRRLMLARDLSKLLMALDARPGESALALAAPYAAAVLARLGLTATAQDSEAAVFDVAGAVLAEEGVETVVAPLTTPAGGGYDIIICEGAIPGRPEAWLKALNVGGRMAVVERTGPAGKAVLYVRGEQGVSRRELFDAAPPMLVELSPEPTFAL